MSKDDNRANRIVNMPRDFRTFKTVNINAELGSYTGSAVDTAAYKRKTIFIDFSDLGSAKYWVEASPDNSDWYEIGSIAEIVADANYADTFDDYYPYMRVRIEMETGSCTATITGIGD